MLTIGVDIDGVVGNFKEGYSSKYRLWFDREIPVPALETWSDDIDLVVKDTFTTEDDFWAWTDAAGVWDDMPSIPGAWGGIYRLLKAGHRVVFITNRHGNARLATDAWVRRHWPRNFPAPEIHHTKDKSKVPVQVWLDDSPKVIAALHAAGKRVVFRFKQPWNKGAGGIAVGSWAEFVDAITFMDDDWPASAEQVIKAAA